MICIAGKQFELEESEEILFVDDVAGMNMAVVEQEILSVLMKNELFGEAAGISRVHLGLRELKVAYREAYQARKTAFYLRDGAKTFGEVSKEIPEGLMHLQTIS